MKQNLIKGVLVIMAIIFAGVGCKQGGEKITHVKPKDTIGIHCHETMTEFDTMQIIVSPTKDTLVFGAFYEKGEYVPKFHNGVFCASKFTHPVAFYYYEENGQIVQSALCFLNE